MTSSDALKRARPNVDSASMRFVRGEIDRTKFEKLAEQERKADRRPPDEQTATSR
jgi:hypothetical protein